MGLPATATPTNDPDVLAMYVVYEKPRDFPNDFVVRRWDIMAGHLEPVKTDWVRTGKTLAEVRRHVPEGMFRLPRDPNDDPRIVEVWT
jgi:hypothetical protein